MKPMDTSSQMMPQEPTVSNFQFTMCNSNFSVPDIANTRWPPVSNPYDAIAMPQHYNSRGQASPSQGFEGNLF